jgi:hypothetical protein
MCRPGVGVGGVGTVSALLVRMRKEQTDNHFVSLTSAILLVVRLHELCGV